VTRFAPSPTGYLHLGHVRSAIEGWRAARRDGGRFLLRLEDLDRTRCRVEYAAAILDDLAWLGLDWDGPVRRQAEHFDDYRRALDRLGAIGVLYHAFVPGVRSRPRSHAPAVRRTVGPDHHIPVFVAASGLKRLTCSDAHGPIMLCASTSAAPSL
jgi:glutamyl/glutaminyl-tRNA synthetase